MDFSIYAVIIIVFLVSFFSLLFISKLPRGKSFDEVLAEKRQLAEKLYGSSYGHKNHQKNKNKKVNQKKSNKSTKTKEIKENEQHIEELESDENSDSNRSDGGSPAHITTTKGHVEFVESEIISTEIMPSKKNVNRQNIAHKRKNSRSPGNGILVNKSESILIKKTTEAEQLNHFEEIQPKDVVELKILHQKEEKTDSPKSKKIERQQRESKKGKNKKISESNDDHPMRPEDIEIKLEKMVVPKFQENVAPNHGHSKEKTIKKKKNEFDLVQKLIDEREGINVNFLIPLLSKAELTRSEIQILIDFLLNKQQDTITVDHSEWIEGRSDVVQKLKKQLSDKEKALQDEQDASAAIQAKLREIRGDINIERAQFNATIKSQIDEINTRNLKIQNLSSEIQYIKDKFNADKQNLNVQLQHMNAKMIQDKKTNSQEVLQQLQQLTDTNNALTQELVNKNGLIHELTDKFQQQCKFKDETMKKISEYDTKLAEYERVLRQKDEHNIFMEQEMNNQRQRVQELTQHESELPVLNEEIQRLRNELCRKDGLENMYQIQLEQLKQQVEQTKSTHLDDANKVEIRNLQNALDSSRKEITEYRNEITEHRNVTDDLNNQIRELKANVNNYSVKNIELAKQVTELTNAITNLRSLVSDKETSLTQFEMQIKTITDRENDLLKQIEKEKTKNNELRTKNWKLIEALQKAESNNVTNLKTNKTNRLDDNQIDLKKILHAEHNRIMQKLEHIIPDYDEKMSSSDLVDFDKWLDDLKQHLNIKLNEINELQKDNNISNNCNNISLKVNDKEEEYTKLYLQNEKLKESLEQYRTVLKETETLLNNLERKTEDREIYWQGVVAKIQSKNLPQVSPLLT